MPRGIDYRWSEDSKNVCITFMGIVGANLQNLDVELAVDISKASTVIHGSSVQVQLVKSSAALWGNLEYNGENVKERRSESLVRAKAFEKARMESAAKEKQEQVKHSEQMQWKQDRENREMLERKRLDAKTAAESQVYEDLARIKYTPGGEGIEGTGQHAHREANGEAMSKTHHEETESETSHMEEQKIVEVFSSDDEKLGMQGLVKKCRCLPAFSEQSVKIGLEFTQRRQIGVPARDRPGREAPRPRADGTGIRGVSHRSTEADLDENSPIMLKNRGDRLMSNGDFRGAYNAYTSALRQSTSAKCFANRALAAMYTGRLSSACEDCRHALAALDLQLKYQSAGVVGGSAMESEDAKRTRAIVYSRLAVMCLWLGRTAGALEAALKAENIAQSCILFSTEERQLLSNDRQEISNLIGEVLLKKKAADELYRHKALTEAIGAYEDLLSSSNDNPVLLANLSQFKLQQGDYQESMRLADKALETSWSLPCVNPVVPGKYEEHLHQLLTDPPTFNDSAVDPTAAQWLMKREGCDLSELPEIPSEFEWVRSGGQEKNWIAVRKKPSEKTIEEIKVCVGELQDSVTSRVPADIKAVAEKHAESEHTTVQKAVLDARRYATDLDKSLVMREDARQAREESSVVNDLLGTGALINKHPLCVNRRKLYSKLQLRWSTAAVKVGNMEDEAIKRLRKIIAVDRDNKEAMLLISRLLAKQDTGHAA
ncbi:hypothetical protein FOL47_008524 [Perkinsus chesapeaki]|uniref:Dyslexia susceptibility 1 candidate 1 n=1 Tax=Perkinsus chesapeaki TaxID=330153 RepID=A0A7J6LDJ2_PERCH|nr:hypothetical protein FOL47_008524 [Perkinsus chesapeaki]